MVKLTPTATHDSALYGKLTSQRGAQGFCAPLSRRSWLSEHRYDTRCPADEPVSPRLNRPPPTVALVSGCQN